MKTYQISHTSDVNILVTIFCAGMYLTYDLLPRVILTAIERNGRDAIMMILFVTEMQDAGTYICSISKDGITHTHSFQLDVNSM